VVGLLDEVEGVAEVGRERVLGGDGVLAGADLDRAVAAGGADEFLDGPAGAGLDEAGDGEGGEHDGQVGVDGLALAVVDGPGPQVVLGHPEAFLDSPQLVAGADHEVRGDRFPIWGGGEVGLAALDPGQGAGFGLEFAVDALDRAVQGDEPVALDWREACDGLGCLGDLLVDAVQRPAGPVGAVLVAGDLVAALVFRPGGPGLGEDAPVGDLLAGVLPPPLVNRVGDVGRSRWLSCSRRRSCPRRRPR
jgi:hypothetical protein